MMTRRARQAVSLWIVFPLLLGLIYGCAAQQSSTVTQQSEVDQVEMPDLVVEERVADEPVVASTAPPSPPPVVSEPAVKHDAGQLGSTEGSTEVAQTVERRAPRSQDLEDTPIFFLDVPFNFDQSSLRDDAVSFLEVNAIRMKEEGIGVVLLEGRGDEVGTSDYNLVLGERRALMVKRYLLNLGLHASDLLTVSYGKERPLCAEHSVGCWQMNRSVRFVPQRE